MAKIIAELLLSTARVEDNLEGNSLLVHVGSSLTIPRFGCVSGLEAEDTHIIPDELTGHHRLCYIFWLGFWSRGGVGTFLGRLLSNGGEGLGCSRSS